MRRFDILGCYFEVFGSGFCLCFYCSCLWLYSFVADYLFWVRELLVVVLFSFVGPIQFGLCFALGLVFVDSCCLCIWFAVFLIAYVYGWVC